MSEEAKERSQAIEIYRSDNGGIELKVRLEGDTVWLSQSQMALLFGRDRTVITRHINNCYKEGELDRNITCAKFAHVGSEADQVYETTLYNLDVIISVGYRVKSLNGTRFRQWATGVLKQYLVKGYAVNEKLQAERYEELKGLVRVMARTIESRTEEQGSEAGDIISTVRDYVHALDTLDSYDSQQLPITDTTTEELFHATYESAIEVITMLSDKWGSNGLFANEKDDSFRSSIGQIYQTFDGRELYPSVEEKAAMLLYLVVKNHSFTDGNKRIAATLFLWFMERNGLLYRKDRSKRIADATLVALTLMIAESRPEEKDMMVRVVVNLINKQND